MEDDPREVDWAPNQIEELKDRVKRLERQTEFETSEDNDRIKAMEAAVRELQSAVASMRTQQDFMAGPHHGEPFEVWCRRKINGLAHAFTETDRMMGYMGQRLDRIENKWSETVTEMKGRLDGLDKADARKGDALAAHKGRMDHFQDGISGLSDQVNSLTETTNRLQELFTRVSALEGYPRRVTPGLRRMSEPDEGPSFIEDDPYDSMKGGVSDADEFMASPVVETAEQIEERRRVLVESMKDRRVTFDPESTVFDHPDVGFIQGVRSELQDQALNQAETRVRDYMANHFSTATIEGVVRAVRGVVSEDDLPKSTFLDRRDVNEREAAKVVGTTCPGSPKCWAMDRLHWHDAHGVVNTKNP